MRYSRLFARKYSHDCGQADGEDEVENKMEPVSVPMDRVKNISEPVHEAHHKHRRNQK